MRTPTPPTADAPATVHLSKRIARRRLAFGGRGPRAYRTAVIWFKYDTMPPYDMYLSPVYDDQDKADAAARRWIARHPEFTLYVSVPA